MPVIIIMLIIILMRTSKPCLFLVQYELVAQVIEYTQHVSTLHGMQVKDRL